MKFDNVKITFLKIFLNEYYFFDKKTITIGIFWFVTNINSFYVSINLINHNSDPIVIRDNIAITHTQITLKSRFTIFMKVCEFRFRVINHFMDVWTNFSLKSYWEMIANSFDIYTFVLNKMFTEFYNIIVRSSDGIDSSSLLVKFSDNLRILYLYQTKVGEFV